MTELDYSFVESVVFRPEGYFGGRIEVDAGEIYPVMEGNVFLPYGEDFKLYKAFKVFIEALEECNKPLCFSIDTTKYIVN